jgi:hypothetical protein
MDDRKLQKDFLFSFADNRKQEGCVCLWSLLNISDRSAL